MTNISVATQQNWSRLNTDSDNKLISRANKSNSKKLITATNYSSSDNATQLLSIVNSLSDKIEDIIYTLCLCLLQHHKLLNKQHVINSLSSYKYKQLPIIVPDYIWDTSDDLLGFIYQSLTQESERNFYGRYYTHRSVVKSMLSNLVLSDNETFCDPCCGAGIFLTSVDTNNPENLYGYDIDPVATLIATTNLLVKFKNHTFIPNVSCVDILKTDIPHKFDYVYTNPPWGSDKDNRYSDFSDVIKNKEKSSMFIIKIINNLLKKNGKFNLLLPTSLLKIQTHKHIRKFIIQNTTISSLCLYNNDFDGVYTDYFSIEGTNAVPTADYTYLINNIPATISIESTNIPYTTLSETDREIIDKMDSMKNDTLSTSTFVLGIVTGDNKNKLSSVLSDVNEPIYTGKEISPFSLKDPQWFITFNPNNLQQCAKENCYRQEKLIYKFISKYPVVAYDNSGSLCLNSANIIIPNVDSMSAKTVCAFLNSKLYRFYYIKHFSDIKVLKSNLMQIPFPKIHEATDECISDVVDKIINENETSLMHYLDSFIYKIFGFSKLQINYIKKELEK